jgi:hypothetical protein
MKWRGRKQSSNIEDRRGQRGGLGGGLGMPGGSRMRIPGGRASGGSVVALIIIVVVALALGVDPSQLLSGSLENDGTPSSSSTTTGAGGTDEMRQFVGVVVAETETYWTKAFDGSGVTYEKPTVVLFSGQSPSGCGLADAATGPFYCPSDRKVYIDLSFFEELRRQFGASGDFAEAYVLAHEIGHHVQNLTGVLPAFNRARAQISETEVNAYSVRVELQADCYAGVWAAYVGQEGLLEPGDIEEALNAASKIGDDTLQKRSQGFAVPDSFTHGTSAQRVKWFRIGQESGDPAACDTIGAETL